MRETKTNVMRILESWHIPYQAHQYEARGPDGVTVAEHLGISVQKVYKTLVTHDEKGNAMCSSSPAIRNWISKRRRRRLV